MNENGTPDNKGLSHELSERAERILRLAEPMLAACEMYDLAAQVKAIREEAGLRRLMAAEADRADEGGGS